jgi:Cu+-exporting ATPase
VKSVAVDPVCKMDVDEESAEFKTEHEGKTYYFCAAGCKTAFEEAPAKYLSEEASSTEAESTETHEMPGEATDKKPWWRFW